MNSCRHCGQPAEGDFCCPGCSAVYGFIHQLGLDDYYKFRTDAAPAEVSDASLYQDASAFLFEGSYYCLLDGLHCAACAWLVERALESVPGVQEAHVNYSTQRLKITPREEQPELLAQSMRTVSRLGYRAIPYDPNRQERPRARQDRALLLRFGVAACAAGNVMLAALALYSGADQDLLYRPLFHKLSFILTLPVVFFSAWPFWSGARNALRQRQITTDVSICLGLAITFLYSVGATFLGSEHVYFDTVVMFVFVLLTGRLLESAARSRAGASLERLLSLHSHTAWRWDGEGYTEVQSDQLTVGDQVEIRPGARVPADGEVLSGTSFVDEAHLTGESQPRSVGPGALLYGGSLAIDGRLEMRLTQTGGSSLLAQVARLVESAQCTPAPIQRGADKVARLLLPLILVLSALTFFVTGNLDRALSVLIITCPCALGIATPLVVSVATGVAARFGVLFRDGVALETARQVTHVVLDKTGTLTLGELHLTGVGPGEGVSPSLEREKASLLRLAASLEQACHHPLARAFTRACSDPLLEVSDLRQHAGLGVEGVVGGRRLRLGRAAFLERPQLEKETSGTAVWLEVDGAVAARFDFADRLRPEAAAFVNALRARGVEVCLASGDRQAVVQDVAAQLGIENVRSECLPLDKVNWVEELQSQGAVVAFIGDGLNDAPALRKANLGITVANGSELSWEVADVVLLRHGLQPAYLVLDLAGAAWRHLLANFGLALLYNAVAIPAAVFGYVTPLWAAVAMPLSSLVVVGQSLTMMNYHPRVRSDAKPLSEPDSSVDVPTAFSVGRLLSET